MSQITATGQVTLDSTTISVGGVTVPNIINHTFSLANTEDTITLPAGTRQFQLKTRGSGKLQISFVAFQSGIVYTSVWPGDAYHESGIDASAPAISLYVQCSKAGDIMEIVSWS